LLLIALVVIPLVTLLSYVINKINYLDLVTLKNQVIAWFAHATWITPTLKQNIVTEIHSMVNGAIGHDNFKKSAMTILTSMQKLSSSTFELSLVIIFFFLLLWKRRPITNFLIDLNPLPPQIMQRVTNEVASTLQIVFCSLLVLAIAQGLAFAGLMMFYDYNVLILGFAAGVCSMIPIFGTALVWVPVAINEFAAGHVIGAVIIVIYGWLVMAVIVDNFLRIILLKKIASRMHLEQPINEFLLFFSIAGGLSTVGFWGIILGPALVALFLALSHIYISLKKS
jgi:predicted PurR-regulated permease PerM